METYISMLLVYCLRMLCISVLLDLSLGLILNNYETNSLQVLLTMFVAGYAIVSKFVAEVAIVVLVLIILLLFLLA